MGIIKSKRCRLSLGILSYINERAMRTRLFIFFILIAANARSQGLEIRGVLPWHNFLSGPSSWNEKDYQQYLDECKENGINLIAFHNYTGGGERYVNYVEPMVKIQYKNVLPEATFDNSGTARWGYLPMKINDFAFGTARLFSGNKGVYFGADCSVTAQTKEEEYQKAQALMQDVLRMAHERGIKMAMGFEFGVAPPEYASIHTHGDMYWLGAGSMVYNPFDPDATGILYATIDNVLQTYRGIDYIWLWLNEHSLLGVDVNRALQNQQMNAWYQKYAGIYQRKDVTPVLQFFGTWCQAYIQKAYDYIKKRSPKTKVVIGGWGGNQQLTLLLQGLNKTLPKDIVFSLLNPNQGLEEQPPVLKEIARDRKVWAIPWLEGDQSLWHLQPRVNMIRKSVKQAAADGLDGVVAIHWRTKEIEPNFNAFTYFATHPAATMTTTSFYQEYCTKKYGKQAAEELAASLAMTDSTGIIRALKSPVYYAYDPTWGRLNAKQSSICSETMAKIKNCISRENNEAYLSNLKWLLYNYQFTLLLDSVGRCMAPAWQLRDDVLKGNIQDTEIAQRYQQAKVSLDKAPVKELFDVFAAKVRSRGELGELSSLNQRLWQEYLLLKTFIQNEDHFPH